MCKYRWGACGHVGVCERVPARVVVWMYLCTPIAFVCAFAWLSTLDCLLTPSLYSVQHKEQTITIDGWMTFSAPGMYIIIMLILMITNNNITKHRNATGVCTHKLISIFFPLLLFIHHHSSITEHNSFDNHLLLSRSAARGVCANAARGVRRVAAAQDRQSSFRLDRHSACWRHYPINHCRWCYQLRFTFRIMDLYVKLLMCVKTEFRLVGVAASGGSQSATWPHSACQHRYRGWAHVRKGSCVYVFWSSDALTWRKCLHVNYLDALGNASYFHRSLEGKLK